MKAKLYEGYTITDEIRIGNIRLAIGESREGPVPYVTLESEFEMCTGNLTICLAALQPRLI